MDPGPSNLPSGSTTSSTSSYGQLISRGWLNSEFGVPTIPGESSVNQPVLPNPYSQTSSSSQSSTGSPLPYASIQPDISQSIPLQSTSGQRTLSSHSRSTSNDSSRTIEDIRDQVAQSIAYRAINRAETVDGSKVGVIMTLSSSGSMSYSHSHSASSQERDNADPESGIRYLRLIASKIKSRFIASPTDYIFLVATSGLTLPGQSSPIFLVSSSPEFISRASMLISSKFLNRLTSKPKLDSSGTKYTIMIRDLGSGPSTDNGGGLTGGYAYDEEALWDILRKAARHLIDPLVPPPGSRGIRESLAISRAKLQRINPRQAYDELRDATNSPWSIILVDIRPEAQRRREGEIPGALIIERNVLEWRLDPRGKVGGVGEDGGRLAIADRYDLRVILFCQEGYTSSLAAASLQEIGLLTATDIIGGYKAWKEQGLPTRVFGSVL
ncbi:hypothetical protein C8Q75DRAFT_730775 [Abortiporus biennis]|nr:hypothetical protein C8Q75DRAFT_730775 [Abortiporus biennis]